MECDVVCVVVVVDFVFGLLLLLWLVPLASAVRGTIRSVHMIRGVRSIWIDVFYINYVRGYLCWGGGGGNISCQTVFLPLKNLAEIRQFR